MHGNKRALALALALAAATATLTATTASAAPRAPRTEKASVASDGADGNSGSNGQSLSADGRYLAFVSRADNLVAGDTNGTEDAFVRDLRTGRTVLASPAVGGGPSTSTVDFPVIDRHGRTVAFSSWATDLVPGDTYDTTHVYVRHLK